MLSIRLLTQKCTSFSLKISRGFIQLNAPKTLQYRPQFNSKTEEKTDAKQENESEKTSKNEVENKISLIEKLLQMENREESFLKIKQEFEKQNKQLEELQAQNKKQAEQYEHLQKLQNETQKKVNELRKHLQTQIEDNELALKRLTKEKEQTKLFAVTNFAKELLEVQDCLESALESSKNLENTSNALFEGVKLTNNVLDKVFKRNQIIKIYPLHQKFDPNLHDAIFQYEDPNLEAGTIGNVAYSGYTIFDRVLRPAKVGVIKKSETQN